MVEHDLILLNNIKTMIFQLSLGYQNFLAKNRQSGNFEASTSDESKYKSLIWDILKCAIFK